MSVRHRVDNQRSERCALCLDNNAIGSYHGKQVCRSCVRKLRDSDLLGSAPRSVDDASESAVASDRSTLDDREGVVHLEDNRYLIVV